MISSNVSRGSTLRTKKSRTLRDDLAERFHELQQLRKKVSELEKRLANDHQHGAGGTRANLAGRPK